MKARPKYVTDVVNSVNARLRALGVKDEANALFQWAGDYLVEKDQYRGFNFFVKKIRNGEVYSVHAGTADPEKFDYLQLY